MEDRFSGAGLATIAAHPVPLRGASQKYFCIRQNRHFRQAVSAFVGLYPRMRFLPLFLLVCALGVEAWNGDRLSGAPHSRALAPCRR